MPFGEQDRGTEAGPQSTAYVIDPRFPGGTSAAVAQELRVVAGFLPRIRVYAVAGAMFKGRKVAPVLADALEDLDLPLIWDAPVISADRVIVHNPAFLKFDAALAPRLLAREVIVVTHENFLRPGGVEAFDVAHCLDLIDHATLASRKWLAPISRHNRATVMRWWQDNGTGAHAWRILPEDWFNICNFDLCPPAGTPRDRRGRHSRPGYEKFPQMEAMDACFPPGAEANVILGADSFLKAGLRRTHWRMLPFRAISVAEYFEAIDFQVYFTAPTWRESFGRVLAEALAAGKVVISDPATARTFDGGVIAAQPGEVDAIIARLIADPARYQAQVRRGQQVLEAFSAERFRAFLSGLPGLEVAP